VLCGERDRFERTGAEGRDVGSPSIGDRFICDGDRDI
jgi:hypothetical protein